MMEGVSDAIKIGTKITAVMERLVTDTNIKQEFRRTGHVVGVFSLGDYQVNFEVINKAHIPNAEITEVSESAV